MDLRGQEIKNTYGNVVTVGSSAGAPTTGELTNGQNTSFTSTYLGGNFGIGSAPTTYGSLNVLGIGSAASAGGAIIDIVGTSGRLASIYTEASGKLVFTADPTNAQAGTSMEFNVDGSNAMFIDSSLRVGIGTTSGTSKANILSSTVAQTVLTLEGNSASSGSVELLEFSRSGGAVSGAIQYQDADTAMSIGTTTSHAFIFNTANAERMRITNAGNVGIGTGSPTQKLTVNGNAAVGGQQAFWLRDDDGFTTNAGRRAWAITANYNAFGTFSIYGASAIDSDPLAGTAFLNITSAGNVGIGTTSPSQDLHVDGNVRITGAVYDSNNVAGTSGQVLSSTGTGTDWVSLSEISGVDGTGTANYISKWSDTDTITDSQIQDDGTTVGIGQAPSTAKLTVSGDIQTAAPETTTASAWKLGNVGLGGVFVGAADYVTISVGGLVVKLPIAIFPETQDYYDRVIADGGTFEGLLGYESATTILKSN
jgi:hypothetical protein